MAGVIHKLDDNEQVAVVLLGNKELLPPLPFYYRQIVKRTPELGMRIFMALAMFVTVLLFGIFRHNRLIPWCVGGAAVAVGVARCIQLGRAARRLKTCPSCHGQLNSDTSYSSCTHCNWVRPMPEAGLDHLTKYFPARSGGIIGH
jgi:hypothetical protein